MSSIKKLLSQTSAERVVVVGSGPSIEVLPDLEDVDLAIFVGDSHLRTLQRARVNMYVRANTEYPRLDNEDHMRSILALNGPIVVASSVMESSTDVEVLAKQHLPGIELYFFDQRHFKGADCQPKADCCNSKLAPTLQEIMAESVGWSHHYSQGATVLLHALSIAILLKPQEVRIYGADIPLKRTGYTYGAFASHPQVAKSKIRELGRKIGLLRGMKSQQLINEFRRRLSNLILGKNAPSIFAENAFDLGSDFQYLVDAGQLLGVSISAYGSGSNLLNVRGVIQIK